MKFNENATIVIMVIVGGLRTFFGPILGAVFIEVPLPSSSGAGARSGWCCSRSS